ncbi:hypothetical protein RF11_07537 [Thelohanellus kitauei]|uniref:ISXO2-like transposase domain-containing protein n=1 Tax=Thelohanellus kitauei TaxID=669202 RepID=A0A0C2MC41_THEKT|nr:hypothetical protein RF11_07537 [Thelohanellus kitauei]
MDFETFARIASDPVSAICFLRHYGILPEEKFCERCSSKMAEHQRPDISDQIYYFRLYKMPYQNIHKIWNRGHTLQIDESVISCAMHNRGHDCLRPQRWVIGIYHAASKICIVVCVPNRKAATHSKKIMRHVSPGTTIHTDGFASYKG